MRELRSFICIVVLSWFGASACGSSTNETSPPDSAPATGGITATGGIIATGGVTATGGIIATGGVTATGGIIATGGMIAVDAAVNPSCPGPSPAKGCINSPTECVPSGCFCDKGVWGCTADCRGGLPLCAEPADAGAKDTGNQDANKNPAIPCASDGECQLATSYCDGCLCLVQKAGDPTPACTGNTVYCLLDPCSLKVARCQAGVCVAGRSQTNDATL